ncbi:MAG: hypothetical protein NTZ05_19050 [Chloroflexi bacterium]|nr:hypothetical protein [Chloroflexota bacterium]
MQVSWQVTDPASVSSTRSGCGASTVSSDTTGATFTCSATVPGGTATQSVTVKRDTSAPVVTVAAETEDGPYAAGAWSNRTVTVTFSCSDAGGSALAGVCPSQQEIAFDGDFPIASSGNVCDNAGNCSSAGFGPIRIDKTSPGVSITVTKDGLRYEPGIWTSQTVEVDFSCYDTGSGMATSCASRHQTFDTDSDVHQAVSGNICDNAGNCTIAQVFPIRIDKTPPAITVNATVDGSPYTAGAWTKKTVEVDFVCLEEGSGLTAPCGPRHQSISGDGDFPFASSGNVCDNAGLCSQAQIGPIRVDKTPPSLYGSRSSIPASGWYNGDLTMTWTCADATSGTTTPTFQSVLTTEGFDQSIAATCSDRAGNTAADSHIHINIDKTLPVITGGASTADGPYAPGVWTNNDVTVAFTCADSGGSGIATNNVVGSTVAAMTATVVSTGACVDVAGNQAAAGAFVPVNIDKTPAVVTPTLTGTAGINGWYRSDVGLTWSVGDPESPVTGSTGCAAASVTADTAGERFTCAASSTGGSGAQSVTIKRDAPPRRRPP